MDLEILKNKERIDDQLDYIFNAIDDLLIDKKFNEIDTEIIQFIDDDFSFELYIGFLTITSPRKKELQYRKLLYKYAVNKGLELYDIKEVKRILKGLK